MTKYPNSCNIRVINAPRLLSGSPQTSLEDPTGPSKSPPDSQLASKTIVSNSLARSFQEPHFQDLSLTTGSFASPGGVLKPGLQAKNLGSIRVAEDDVPSREIRNKRRKLDQTGDDILQEARTQTTDPFETHQSIDIPKVENVEWETTDVTGSPILVTSGDFRPAIESEEARHPPEDPSLNTKTGFSVYVNENRSHWKGRKDHWASCSNEKWVAGGEG
ncbi:hypothetical protein FRC17_010996 [Serendipita sp. 399]|nr:hypothetical protein FRC17_010996 [Serendipita sp. 399]